MLFRSKADKSLDKEEIFGKEEEHPTTTTQPQTVSPASTEAPAVVEPVEQAPAEPEKKLSRKEMLKLQKQQKASSPQSHKSATMVSDSGKKIKDSALDEILDELYFTLLEADVALPVADKIREGVRENLLGKKYDRSYSLEEVVEMSVKDAVRDVLEINEFDFDQWIEEQKRPTVIMFVGIDRKSVV